MPAPAVAINVSTLADKKTQDVRPASIAALL